MHKRHEKHGQMQGTVDCTCTGDGDEDRDDHGYTGADYVDLPAFFVRLVDGLPAASSCHLARGLVLVWSRWRCRINDVPGPLPHMATATNVPHTAGTLAGLVAMHPGAAAGRGSIPCACTTTASSRTLTAFTKPCRTTTTATCPTTTCATTACATTPPGCLHSQRRVPPTTFATTTPC